MQLRNQVEWALHCCTLLAALPPGRYLPTKDLAEFHDVPKEYLSKALQGLSQDGIVESALGPSGGYRLARSPSDVTFLDVVEAVEGKASSFVCTEIRRNGPCSPKGADAKKCFAKPCGVAQVMWSADRVWRARLAEVTLADVTQTLAESFPQNVIDNTIEWINERI